MCLSSRDGQRKGAKKGRDQLLSVCFSESRLYVFLTSFYFIPVLTVRGFYIQSRVSGWVWAGALYISESRSTEPARGQPTYTQAYRWKAGREGSVSGRQCDQRWFSAGQRQWLRTIACSSVQTPAGKVKVLSQVFWSATPRIVPSTCKCLKNLHSQI